MRLKTVDDKFSKLVRGLKPKCLMCSSKQVDAAHFCGRGNPTVRYDLDNVWPLCREHHVYADALKRDRFEPLVIEEIGLVRVEFLRRRSRAVLKLDLGLVNQWINLQARATFQTPEDLREAVRFTRSVPPIFSHTLHGVLLGLQCPGRGDVLLQSKWGAWLIRKESEEDDIYRSIQEGPNGPVEKVPGGWAGMPF